MASVDQEFLERVARIPHHGLGLSVDVYQPDLFELVQALEHRGLPFGYLEIFKAAAPALAEVRRRLPSASLEYHAEGLWVTQPDFRTHYPIEEEIATAAEHLQTLGSTWVNCEGASKQMAGYSFGTYLPPLFTHMSATFTAENIGLVQRRVDDLNPRSDGLGALFLLETPPLTYFGFGDLDMADFFRHVTELAPCGIVLDIGHLWTVYRYAGEWRRRSLREFLSDFLDRFPLERVVHIHLAGLALHERLSTDAPDPTASGDLPWWIDAHAASIPAVLFGMLEHVLSHPRLIHAKGIALEVDNKMVQEIVREFSRFHDQFQWWERQAQARTEPTGLEAAAGCRPNRPKDSLTGTREELHRQYDLYARVVTGRADPSSPALPCQWLEPGALEAYRRTYLPNEILHWGGDLCDMFPGTCRQLGQAGLSLDGFVDYWFRSPRPIDTPYDFFLLKLERLVAFVAEMLPSAGETATREAAELRNAYQAANEYVRH
jgi:uncharacterized protein (UPF0276 family)